MNAKKIVALVGYLHQLIDCHVALKRAPKVTNLAKEGATVVVRLVVAQQHAPSDIWTGLMKGKVPPEGTDDGGGKAACSFSLASYLWCLQASTEW